MTTCMCAHDMLWEKVNYWYLRAMKEFAAQMFGVAEFSAVDTSTKYYTVNCPLHAGQIEIWKC